MRVAREGAVRVTIQIGRTGKPGVGRVGRELRFVRNAEATKKFIDGRIRGSRIAYVIIRHRSETVLPAVFWKGLSFRGGRRRRVLGFSFRRGVLGSRLLIGIVRRRRSIGALGMRRIRRRVRRRSVIERMAVILRR